MEHKSSMKSQVIEREQITNDSSTVINLRWVALLDALFSLFPLPFKVATLLFGAVGQRHSSATLAFLYIFSDILPCSVFELVILLADIEQPLLLVRLLEPMNSGFLPTE